MALETFRFELLDSNNYSTSGPSSTKGMLINPPFENITKSSFPQETVRTEVSSNILKLIKCEGFQMWGCQYVTFRSWSRKRSTFILFTMCLDWWAQRNKRTAASTGNFRDSWKGRAVWWFVTLKKKVGSNKKMHISNNFQKENTSRSPEMERIGSKRMIYYIRNCGVKQTAQVLVYNMQSTSTF